MTKPQLQTALEFEHGYSKKDLTNKSLKKQDLVNMIVQKVIL